jgi:hypothetical protein
VGPVSETSADNIIAVLERSNRVREIGLTCNTSSAFEKASTAMQVPFLELTSLDLDFSGAGADRVEH